MDSNFPTLPVFGIKRHRMTTDGTGVSTLVGAYGCPLKCRYCLNPHAWNPETLKICTNMSPEDLYERVKIDALYFLATGGGVTFGGGEALLHVDFIRQFRKVCGPGWTLTVETSLNVPSEQLEKAFDTVNDYIVDIKDLEPSVYEAYTGMPVDNTLRNLKLLSEKISPEHVYIRVPEIPGYNTKTHIRQSVSQLKNMGFINIEVFPYVIRQEKGVPKHNDTLSSSLPENIE